MRVANNRKEAPKLGSRRPFGVGPVLAAIAILGAGESAHAQYSDPPDIPVVTEPEPVAPDHPGDDYYEPEPYLPHSTVRVLTGPTLRISEHHPDAGLFAAAEFGREAAGLRLTGAWIGAGSAPGLSQYTAELWVDLGQRTRIHPILGAGAGVAVLGVGGETPEQTDTATVGVGVLRASLQYQLPIEGTDARAGLDALGSLPAVGSDETGKLGPWVLFVGTVGVGF